MSAAEDARLYRKACQARAKLLGLDDAPDDPDADQYVCDICGDRAEGFDAGAGPRGWGRHHECRLREETSDDHG